MSIKHLNWVAILVSLLWQYQTLQAATTFTTADLSGNTGESKLIPVYITSDEGALAAQFDIYFDPSKVSIGKIEQGTALYDHSLDVPNP
jgi:hypothetical protein